jgi:UrcA family protein
MNSNVKSYDRGTFGYAAAACLTCVLLAFNVHAADQVRSETVKFADLNLDTPAGVETLYGRIHAAARRVCYEPSEDARAYTVCVKKAQSDAVGKVNLPLLTELFQKKTGNHPQTFIANR